MDLKLTNHLYVETFYTSHLSVVTVEPRYNDPRYNDIPGITINMLPAKVTVKCMGQNPDITIFDITIFPI